MTWRTDEQTGAPHHFEAMRALDLPWQELHVALQLFPDATAEVSDVKLPNESDVAEIEAALARHSPPLELREGWKFG